MRLQRPWNVPIHIPRVEIGSIAETRVSISFAALLGNVTARTPARRGHAMRVVSTRVVPEPAPARISACWLGRVTAWSCSGLRASRRLGIQAANGGQVYQPALGAPRACARGWRAGEGGGGREGTRPHR